MVGDQRQREDNLGLPIHYWFVGAAAAQQLKGTPTKA